MPPNPPSWDEIQRDLEALGIAADEYLSEYDQIEQFVRETAISERRPVRVTEVAEKFGVDKEHASKRLSVLKSRGKVHWLKRGHYIPAGVVR